MNQPGNGVVSCPWTNGYGLGRSLLATSTLVTLLAHDPVILFRPLGIGVADLATTLPLVELSLFSLLSEHLVLAKWIAIGVLLVVVSGWRPRVTGVLHWWVSYSFTTSCVIVEGGDQVVSVLALLLIPVTLTDPRRSHWSACSLPLQGESFRRMLAVSVLWAVRLQVSAIYFFAFLGKSRVDEWANGTAIYYWSVHPLFGASGVVRDGLEPILTNRFGVVVLTWAVIAFEALLAAGLVMKDELRLRLLVLGLAFHAAIAILHGLVTFSLGMAGGLILYLRPVGQPLDVSGLLVRLRRLSRPFLRYSLPEISTPEGVSGRAQ
ncbi:MAG TPA: sporulation-delaying protein SdpB family protein [Thermoanaerobaculia bacterium]|nr:sporulation-delaying protein SdpB family protein [Thermoanaerobaculia bacterium]